MRRVLVGLAFVLPLAAGCRVAPPTATPNDAARANVELAELARGRSLMITKCGNCHRPPMPSDHSAREWPQALDEMAGRANLDVQERHLIQQYLVTMAAR